jgi:uncharacterized protein (TIGR02646 family)
MGNRPLKRSTPFVYPSKPHVRKHGPEGYRNYRLYLNWLRDEFSFRCVYCLRRENWITLKADMQIDHFVPKSIHPKGALDYDNLVYSCSSCNHSKAAHLAPDPCRVAYASCVTVEDDGKIRPLSDDGIALIETLGLDDNDYKEMRQAVFELLDELSSDGKAYCRWFGYPNNLPDLSQEPKPPGGNKRPHGLSESCFERARDGRLPKLY